MTIVSPEYTTLDWAIIIGFLSTIVIAGLGVSRSKLGTRKVKRHSAPARNFQHRDTLGRYTTFYRGVKDSRKLTQTSQDRWVLR
jgi:hypothetical protein